MKLVVIKRPDGLLECSTELDYKEFQKLTQGEILEVRATKIRDPINHRRYFVMHNIYFENQEDYQDEYICRKSVEMEAGYYEEAILVFQGEKLLRRWPKSIAYDQLDETEFVPLKQRCGDVICKRLGLDDRDLQDEILRLAYFN